MLSRHLHIFGPPCSGKRYLSKLLKREFSQGVEILSPAELVKRAANDDDWNARFRNELDKRLPLPLPAIHELFLRQTRVIGDRDVVVIWLGPSNDGFIAWARDNGFLDRDNSLAVVLLATKSTCLHRAERRRDLESDGEHRDDSVEAVIKGYADWIAGRDGLQAKLNHSVDLIQVDADQDVYDRVFPDAVACVNRLRPKPMSVDRRMALADIPLDPAFNHEPQRSPRQQAYPSK